MPRIELSNHPSLRCDVFAHVFWPNDQDKRNAYIAYTNELSHYELGQTVTPFGEKLKLIMPDGHFEAWTNSKKEAFKEVVIEPDSVGAAIANGQSLSGLEKEIQRDSKDLLFVGYTVVVLKSMITHHSSDNRLRLGPGIKKAQDVVADIQGIAPSRVDAAWVKYRSVAHFCAAAKILTDGLDELVFVLHSGNKELFAISQGYRETLTTFKPHGRFKPLISKEEIWLPPEEFDLPGVSVDAGPLPSTILESLSQRESR